MNNSLNNSTITPFGGNFSPPSTILSSIVAIGAAVGIFVNLAALFSLRYGRKRVKSEKSRFLLAMLTLNNALALVSNSINPDSKRRALYCLTYCDVLDTLWHRSPKRMKPI